MSYGVVQAEKMTTESGYSLGAGNASSFKNRIINPGMVIDQRNAGASVTITTDPQYTLDRWKFGNISASKISAQQSSTAPAGFTKSLLITSLAATSVGSGDYYGVQQDIEGLNIADLGFGTANAKSITVSFWARSSLTGQFGGSIRNANQNRSYPFSYTIDSANTFEYKTVTIPGDTTGTWATDNTVGLRLTFALGVGSTYTGTANAWAATNLINSTGSTNLVSTSGATLYITGVQLEVGTVATSFDFRSYGTEFALCQRYYQEFSSGSLGNYGGPGSSSFVAMFWYTGVTMRSTPSASLSTSSPSFTCQGVASITSSGVAPTGPSYSRNVISSNFAGNYSSGSSGQCVQWGSGYIAFSAEL